MAKKPNKIQLNDKDNVFIGTNKVDVVYGNGGNDDLSGGGKNDKLFGGEGDDILRGGSGNDRLNGGVGNDDLFGGNGDDTLIATSGDDTVDGGAGDDVVKLFGNYADATVVESGDGFEITTTAGTVFIKNVEAVAFADQTVLVEDLPRIGVTQNLTTNTDNISISTPNSIDTIIGVIGDSAVVGSSTYTAGDVVSGNGYTILQLAVAADTTAAFATVSDVASVDLINAHGGTATINAGAWTGVAQIDVNSGSGGGYNIIENLEVGVDLINGVDGTLEAQFANDETRWLYVIGDDTSLSIIDDAVDATVGVSETAYVYVEGDASVVLGDFTASVDDNGYLYQFVSSSVDVTIGNATATLGDDGASYYLSVSGSGDVTVGDVNVAGGTNASISVTIENTDGHSIAVGDVTLTQALGGTSGYVGLYVSNDTATGDVTIGNVILSAGASADATFSVSHTGTAGQSIGNLTVGDVSMSIDHDGSIEYTAYFSGSSTAGTETMGDMVLGDITIAAGADASVSISIDMQLNGTLATVDAMGDFTMGNLDVDLGIGASLSMSVSVDNYASGDLGTVVVGDLNLDMDDGASASIEYSFYASSGDVGSVTIGNVDVVMGVSASINTLTYDISGDNVGSVTIGTLTAVVGENSDFDDYSLSVSANSGDIGTVTVGDINLTLAQSSSFSYSAYFYATNDVGSITYGDITSVAAEGATGTYEISVSASNGDIGSVTIGDITLTNTAINAYQSVEVSVTAANGDTGALNIGNVALNAFAGAWVSLDVFVSGITGVGDGDVTVGGLAITGEAVVKGTDWDIFIGDSTTYSGDISIGAVTVGVTEAVAATTYDLTDVLFDVTTTGSITLGSVDYSAFTAAAGTALEIDLSGYLGDTTVIGSELDDHITDNDGVNTFTGGAGADDFEFLQQDANNVGLSAAGADVITDFDSGVDVITFNNTVAITVGEYFEGTFSTFALFVAGAKTQMTSSPEDDLIAGQVGSDVYIAIDNDDGDKIDHIIVLKDATLADINFADFAV